MVSKTLLRFILRTFVGMQDQPLIAFAGPPAHRLCWYSCPPTRCTPPTNMWSLSQQDPTTIFSLSPHYPVNHAPFIGPLLSGEGGQWRRTASATQGRAMGQEGRCGWRELEGDVHTVCDGTEAPAAPSTSRRVCACLGGPALDTARGRAAGGGRRERESISPSTRRRFAPPAARRLIPRSCPITSRELQMIMTRLLSKVGEVADEVHGSRAVELSTAAFIWFFGARHRKERHRGSVDLPTSPSPLSDEFNGSEFDGEHTSELGQGDQRYANTPYQLPSSSVHSVGVHAEAFPPTVSAPQSPRPSTFPVAATPPITYKYLGIDCPDFRNKAEQEAWERQPKHGEAVMFIGFTSTGKVRRVLTRPDAPLAPGHIVHCYGELQGNWRVTAHYFVHKQQVYNVWRDDERCRTTHVEVLRSQVKLEMRWEDKASVTMWGLVKGRSFRPAVFRNAQKKIETDEERSFYEGLLIQRYHV
ncbi:hypothetical protein DFH07DRAFT_963624 [Mycena maculata]|uniref:Uncharacterized protein n=1 Tax=Mycena maculata TaxID=230809 RepID=A0AAD7IJU2_9AGAR|nr:hypothetical protein DFH07DRAFT_963624 [Mycena maculata]